jgi:superfamily I DNA/RNA helicase
MEKASQIIISRNPRTLDDVIKYAHIYLSVKGKQDKVKIDKDISEFYINQTKKSVTKLFVRIPSIFRKRDDYLTNKTPLHGDFVKEALPVSKEKGVIVTDTIHSRKGLEYDHVAIVVPVVDPFPHARNLQSLCLEYVALTRAKKNCVIYFYTTQPGFNENSMISSNRVPFLDTMRYYFNQYKKFPENCFNQQLPDTGFDEELDISKDHYYHEKTFEEEGL